MHFFLRNIHDDSMPNIVLRVTANIVFGYATYVLLLLHTTSHVHLCKYEFLTKNVIVSRVLCAVMKLPRRRGLRAELQWLHQWSVCQVSEEAAAR